jgi:glycosyltransferase involved in cell wall biosynthesis
MSALNICIISQEFPPYTNWGGIAVYNSELADAYSALGHRVTVVSRMEKGAPEFEKLASGVEVWRIGHALKRKYFVGRTIDRILHARDVFKKIRALDSLTRFDIIETTEAGLEGEKLLRDESFSKRMVIQCNGSNALGVVPKGLFSGLHRLDWKWSFRREQKTLNVVRRIIVTTEATRQFLLKQGVDSGKIQTIYQGIDVKRFAPSLKMPAYSTLEVGFAGRLEDRKGIDFIWKVIEKIGPDAGIRFHFKGVIHPSTKKDVEEKLKQFSSFVVYHKAGMPHEMQNYYQSLHVLLQPSRFENFGLVYAEGMSCGLIVFAGIQGGGSEIVKNGMTGFLVDPDGEADFVVAKLKEIAVNPSAFEEMRRHAREDVINRFSLQSCARQKITYYHEYADNQK